MAEGKGSAVGRVVAIWLYPIKSMMGEESNAVEVTDRGLLGDRAYALVDRETGKVVSAKNPRRWPAMFDLRATYVEPPIRERSLPAARVALPDGELVTTDQSDVDVKLSAALGRPVSLVRQAPDGAVADGYWPDHEWLTQRDEVFEFPLPPGTFFDGASVHLVTTSTLDRLRALSPASRFEVPRFRPNFVIDTGEEGAGFVENAWIGKALALGAVQLRIDGPCPRCVMTTLSQGSLPTDPAVLRTAVRSNDGNVGIYATVALGGRVRRGDIVQVF